jgi:hypothetical protein
MLLSAMLGPQIVESGLTPAIQIEVYKKAQSSQNYAGPEKITERKLQLVQL